MSNSAEMSDPGYRREVAPGLLLRWSTERDLARIAELCGSVFRRTADEPPNRWLEGWIGELMSGHHPHMGPGDFAAVEETAAGRIVSASCLISYAAELEGVRIPFGRPEIVATHPEYRNRGLVRAIFDVLHARSAARGHLLQGITGIPYYYRLFGYEYAADLGGEVSVPFPAVPPLKVDAPEPYSLRPATEHEVPLLGELYDADRARYALTTPIDEAYWRWAMSGTNARSGEGWTPRLILSSSGEVVGYVLTWVTRDSDEVSVRALGVRPGVSLAAVLPSVLRSLVALAGEIIPRREGLAAPARVSLMLFRDHPAYRVLTEGQTGRPPAPYAWYLRVPDLEGFLLHIRVVLERRLAASPLAGHTGELRLAFYPRGVRMLFEAGKLVAAEAWREDHAWGPRAQAGFPPQVFLKLVFGYRSLAELRQAYPDVFAGDEARPLLEALFPPRATWLLPLD